MKWEKRLKIYFAASIRGGRQDAHFYKELVDHLKQYGNVLSEHVGDPEITGREDLSDKVIYDQDMTWLKESHIVISEVTTPSLGVGYELSKARLFGKPTLCLYRPEEGKSLSSMIAGAPGYRIKNYK